MGLDCLARMWVVFTKNNMANTLESDAILMSICPTHFHLNVADLVGLLKGPVHSRRGVTHRFIVNDMQNKENISMM